VVRKLRFFPEIGSADPLWSVEGTGIALTVLPVSEATIDVLRDWAARCEPLERQRLEYEDYEADMMEGPVEPVPSDLWRRLTSKVSGSARVSRTS